MSESQSSFLHCLQVNAFDCQPTPTVVLSDHCKIASVNRACHSLLAITEDSINKHVSCLPVAWQDGSNEALFDLLTAETDYTPKPGNPLHDNVQAVLRLHVDIYRGAQATALSASLLVTDFLLGADQYRMLSFEHLQENHTAFRDSRHHRKHSASPEPVDSRSNPPERVYSGALPSTATSQEQLDARFAQLRDAIYFGVRNRSGFLLSADETFCFPNYQGARRVTPVEIDDVELFFRDWDVWDPHFTKRLPVSEFPSIWLNRHRTPFERRRYGLKEAGTHQVLETTGEPLYDHLTGEYVGGVFWIENLGEYEEVLIKDLKADLVDFRSMCNRLPHILWTMDSQGHADYFSQSWYDFTGLTEEQSTGLKYAQAIDTDDLTKAWVKFHKASEDKTECLFEARYRRYDGHWFWMSVRSKPLFDADGSVLKWYGTSTNIDDLMVERMVAERQRSQLMEMLLLADIGLFEVDESRQLKMLEGGMSWIEQQPKVQSLTKLDDMNDGARKFKTHLQEVMSGKQAFAVFEEQIGARWFKFRLVPESDESSVIDHCLRKVLGCSVDITEQRMHAALASENARLAHEASLETEKNRLKSAFLAHMSHEIRTPIAGIIGTANLMAETRLNAEQKDGIGDIQVLGSNLLTIVNDVLDFSKIEAGKTVFEEVDYNIHLLVSQVRKSFDYALRGKPLQIICQQDLSIPLQMIGDPGKVKQILTNLVANAVKFTPSGTVELSISAIGDQVRVAVKDTGEGIDDQTMSTLFQPFVQGDASTARRYGGTGLGLTISREFAVKMNGTLNLSSIPSRGTEAVLTLPRGMTTTASQSRALPIITKHITNGVKQSALQPLESPISPKDEQLILVVEDNAVNQKVALSLVRKLGYRAAAAWNGQEALDYVESNETPFLILMDCQMPLLDGYQATRELRTNKRYQQTWLTPIVALTASAISGDKEKCYAAGMDAYLSKPVSKKTLQATLDHFSKRTDLQRPSFTTTG